MSARPRSGGSSDPLKQSIDKLSTAITRLDERIESLEGGGSLGKDSSNLERHIRRYGAFYALATVWLLMLALLPSRQSGDEARSVNQVGPGAAGAQSFDDATGSGGTAASNNAGDVTGGAPTSVGGVSYTIPKEVVGLDPLAWDKEGVTRGGFECGPGVRQLPWSRYSVPCYPRYDGPNGGKTHRGVTADKIVVVLRDFADSANSAAVDALVQQAGFASDDEFDETRRIFVKYFNKVFELWGRKVELIEYKSENGNSTDEAQSKGKDGACADADSILDKFQPFAVLSASHPFGECGAERGLIVLGTGAYYPESWYRKYHPYLWNGVMECERIAYMNAEYIGKRLAHKKAIWAKSLEKDLPREFGIYVPNNDQYQSCVELAADVLKKEYNTEFKSRYNYVLDVSRFPDEAAQAIVRFNADGVTTIFLACDPLSPIFLTQSARGQEYWPEWVTNGAGLTDVDQFARLWDQEEIQWSLFGMSTLGDNARILGPKGEGTVAYKKATGDEIPPGTQTQYYAQMRYFSEFQAAGPILTPQTFADAHKRLPPGGAPEFEVGYTSYQTNPDGSPGTDHTSVDDMREIYWLCTSIAEGDTEGASRCAEPKGFDGKGGTYIPTYNAKRFLPGQWPRGDPPIFPEK